MENKKVIVENLNTVSMTNFFKDKAGKTVIAQKPNLPLIMWAIAKLLSLLPTSILVSELFSMIAFGSLFTWAWLEIFSGVNMFRKFLGGIVMVMLLGLRLN